MTTDWIKNYKEIATTKNRELALDVVSAGLDAINTRQVIKNSMQIKGNTLQVLDRQFDLSQFKRIKVLGFGKCSCDAAQALEEVLGSKINEGVVIGLETKTCEIIQTFKGTHPRPSPENVVVGKKINDIATSATEDDLVIVVVSGGGSALLCYPQTECDEGIKLYNASIKGGISISELNTVRKHISGLKGGRLAKLLYPATVISLIFSDVPGDSFVDVASGPTYKDETTISDAQAVIDKHQLGEFVLSETPKEDRYFEKVYNIVLVSNKTAVAAMDKRAKELGLESKILSYELYEPQDKVIQMFVPTMADNRAVMGAGEPALKIDKPGGSGGRNLFLGMKAIGKFDSNSVFVALASDGLDNCSAAGAIIDSPLAVLLQNSGIEINEYLANYDALVFFEKLGDGLIITGPTGANVSDIMLLITKHD